MKRRIPIVGILIILIGISFTPLSQGMTIRESYNPISSRDILYVGGSGPNNYTRIQYAIDDANDGDTVFVYEGEYNEQIYINTTISLIGENKATTIINGSFIGRVVTVNADYVDITGFTIEKSGNSDNGIEVKSDYCNISDNIFDENGYGIYIYDTDNHTITENTFLYHREGCIETLYSNNIFISGNTFFDTFRAISTISCDYGIISDNQLNWLWDGIGISLCNYFIIANNTVIGIGRNQGIRLSYSENCTVSGNDVDYCDEGIQLYNSNYNNIYGNENSNCDYDGIFLSQKSNYNVISNNILSDNEEGGITMWDFNTNNTIYYNTISSNAYGFNIKYQASSNDNIIYHNNLIDNGLNGFDGCLNIWNDSYPSGGNYWSDYTGYDVDGDGIGDTARNVPGGAGNKDYYPLMNPWGEQRPVANYTLIEEYGGYVFNASSSYDRDGEVVSYGWDFGDGTIDNGMIVSHAYNDSGEYDIILTIIDNEGYKGNHTKTIDAVKNYPPDIPSIDGPSSGGWGKPYHFTFQSSDNEGSDVWYFVDWGDGKDTGWMGPYISGDEISDSHTWTEQETFTIRCKAKDMYGSVSDWGEFEMTIPRTRASYHWFLERFPLLERLLGWIR